MLKESDFIFPEERMRRRLVEAHIPARPGFVFSAERQWVADFVLLDQKGFPLPILIEVEGVIPDKIKRSGRWIPTQVGRHQTFVGYTEDCRKYNAAWLLGYIVLRFTPAMVDDGSAIGTIQQALAVYQAHSTLGGSMGHWVIKKASRLPRKDLWKCPHCRHLKEEHTEGYAKSMKEAHEHPVLQRRLP